MKKVEVILSNDQWAALEQATQIADMALNRFIVLAIQMLALRHGVNIPERREITGITPLPAAQKNRGGRPRKPPGEMTRHVPSGYRSCICPHCQRSFRVEDEVTVYCSDTCETRASNRRMYIRYKERGVK